MNGLGSVVDQVVDGLIRVAEYAVGKPAGWVLLVLVVLVIVGYFWGRKRME
jgi:hypothetical protein